MRGQRRGNGDSDAAGDGETSVHVGADLASGDLFVHAQSEASLPTAQAGGEAQIGDTLSFNGASSPNSATTLHMTGTMSNSNGFTAGSLEIFDDTGLLTAALEPATFCGQRIANQSR